MEVFNGDPDAVESAVKEAIMANLDPLEAIEKGLAKGLREVGQRFGRGELLLTDWWLQLKR